MKAQEFHFNCLIRKNELNTSSNGKATLPKTTHGNQAQQCTYFITFAFSQVTFSFYSTNAEELVKQYWDTHGGLEERDKLLGKKRPVTTKKKTTPLKRQRQDSPEATIKRKKTADTASDHEQNTQKNKEEEEEKIESVSEMHSPLMKPEETKVEEVKGQIPKDTKTEKQDVETSEAKQVASAEEEYSDDYEEDDIVTDPDYRRDWDWTKDIDSLIKVQRGRKRELEALIRWYEQEHQFFTLILKSYIGRMVYWRSIQLHPSRKNALNW